ncbi:MAG: DUF4302 domain-containing protein [Chitinophaga sp.]|uniref:DUF4302 domain-containing protein n=1 Tax=Chitinophaga sp. TaxID=1869181 RepID=UPI0025C185D6|nr:DUF4302 domain-containing protein [Chitinophaga sp.]MBV8254772.1 DUF4302 domain-containing protein [Chitinophaga sp.]
MKKFALYTLLAIAAIACKKSSDPFMEDPDKRLIQRLGENMQLLTSSQYGWKATIYPKGGKGFYYYFKFNNDNSVDMLGDFNTTTATTVKTSTFRLKALQWPTLIFDTYGYIHLPSDPAPGVSGGTAGAGLQSDYQFMMDKMVGDTFYLIGMDKGNLMTMVKMTAAEQQDVLAGKIADRMADITPFVAANQFPYITFKDGTKADAAINISTRRIRLGYAADANTAVSKNRGFAYTPYGIILDSAFVYNGFSIRELIWDATKKSYYAKNGSEILYLQNGSTPVVPLKLVYGPGKDYTAIEYNASALKGTLGTDFDPLYTQCLNTLKTNGYNLTLIRMIQNVDLSYTLRFTFNNGTTSYNADVYYKTSKNADGSTKFIFDGANGNATSFLAPGFAGVRNYFESNAFNISWVANTIPGSTLILGAFVKSTDATQFFYGVVGN